MKNKETNGKIDIVIPYKPIPQARHRMRGIMAYDPQHKLKQQIKAYLRTKIKNKITGPLDITIVFFMPIPKSKKYIKTGTPHCIKPDIDNLIKFILDCLTGIAYDDDAAIAALFAAKAYSDTPETHITISDALYSLRDAIEAEETFKIQYTDSIEDFIDGKKEPN